MPELPDITLYIEHLQSRIAGKRLEGIRIASPFLVRTFDPPISHVAQQNVLRVNRIGKQIVLELEGDLFIVIHLMVAGRFQWKPANAKIGGKIHLAGFDFSDGTLLLAEAGTKKRASLHLDYGKNALTAFETPRLGPRDRGFSAHLHRS